MNLDIDKAMQEVANASDAQIEYATAQTWAARAAACYLLAKQAIEVNDVHSATMWADRAKTFRDEALEHAALVMDRGATVAEVQDAIGQAIS